MTSIAPPADGGPVALLLSGPTASGKSAVALEVAERLGGEIVSADSMMVFRGLDIGTAKPDAADRARVPHHLLDVVDPRDSYDAARWLAAAREAASAIAGRGRVPVVCGGTGLYFKAWLAGLDSPAPADPALRAGLESMPLEVLLAELHAGDPETHARIDRANPRRVVRAVEILRLTGRPQVRRAAASTPSRAAVLVLRRQSEDLRRRIDRRVEAMFAAGLIEETRVLLQSGLGGDRTALQAIGYRQVVEHLRGERDLAATVALVKSRTWQFARRQMTWFRHQLPATWLEVRDDEDPATTAGRAVAWFKAR